jgi:trans-aconitate methyltransferase
MSAQPNTWNADLYQSSHSFIWEHGRDLLRLLEIKSGERILDLGCGTGQLTAEVARCGAEVVGVDASPEMIVSARRNFPTLRFEVADAAALPFREEFDAVLSNAALHWISDQSGAIASVARTLKKDGRFVFEMGGRGNLHHVLQAASAALGSLGVQAPLSLVPWYFPSIGEYASLLESQGLEVRFAALFDRPTVLEGGEQGFAAWIQMFGGFALSAVRPKQQVELSLRWQDSARPVLFRKGVWTLDYRRLRMLAVKV